MRHTCVRVASIVLLCLVVGCANVTTFRSTAETKGKGSRAPVVWGTMSQCNGCVIFREYVKTKVGFWVVAVTSESHGELEVIETDGYVLEPRVWEQKETNINELQRRAVQDKIRYVKIKDDFTPEELEAARSLCRKQNVQE